MDPYENGAPRGPRILTFWGPHRDFGAPFELAQWHGGEESLAQLFHTRMSGPVKRSIQWGRVEHSSTQGSTLDSARQI